MRRSFLCALLTWAACIAHAQQPAYTDSLTREAARARTDTARVNILLALATAHRPGDVTKQFSYANEALAIAGKASWDKGLMYAEELIGDCYARVLAYGDALAYFKSGVVRARRLHIGDAERAGLAQIVKCYRSMDSLPQATGYQKLLLDLAVAGSDNRDKCRQTRDYAMRLSAQQLHREAIAYLRRDIQFADTAFRGEERASLMADLYNALATIYNTIYDKDSTLQCLHEASRLIRQSGNATTAAYITSSYCDVYYTHKQYDSAILYGEETIRRGIATGNLDMQRYYCDLLSKIYRAASHPEAALAYHIRADSLAEAQYDIRARNAEAHQLMKISIEQQTSFARLERQSLQAARRSDRVLIIAALSLVAALTILTLLIYRNLRQKKKSNRIISEQAANLQQQNALIDEALKAKELMLKETHHRIKNNLQLISSLLELQVAGMSDGQAASALRTAQRRIQSIATVHNKLHGSGSDERIEFSGFVNDLFTRLAQAFSDRSVQFENGLPPTQLPLNTVVLLGLILNELVTNTFKHAFEVVAAPAVRITLAGAGDDYTLTYYDNGPGLPEGAFDAPKGSLGLYLVKRMSKQLKGTTNYTYDGGSRFTISFRALR